MSAESPRTHMQHRGAVSVAPVSPQQVTDPTILDSVAGFINEVVPTAYNGPSEVEDKVQWAHFEQLDRDEGLQGPDGEGNAAPPLLLVLGYATGIQIWAIPSTGEATEILSWRHSTVRVLKFIPTPYKVGSDSIDSFASSRPLIAVCDSITNYSTLTFKSLKTTIVDPVKQIQFKTSLLNVYVNRRSVVVTFPEKIAIFDAHNLESRLCITTCYPSSGIQQNPVALSSRWLAYAEKKLNTTIKSSGGNEGEGVQSYKATVLHAAKSLGRGIKEFTETVAGSLTGNPNFKPGSSSNSPQAGGVNDGPQKGIITVLDIENKNIDSQTNHVPTDSVIAHFVAHTDVVVCMRFDPSGLLLLTADRRGHDFHVFRLQPHPAGSSLAAVHHLYVLHRGDTSAKVQDMCFSPDSRWVTISTLRGTTHVFPVTPYGGNVSVRTHATAHVVNKMSRYQRSAGLTSDGRSSSPITATTEPPASPFPYRNPRFPPHPQPVTVPPLAQLRQPIYIQNLPPTTANSASSSPSSLPGRPAPRQRHSSSSSEDGAPLRVVATFAAPRAWPEKGAALSGRQGSPTRAVEALFVLSCYGTLVQYDLDPVPTAKERVSSDSGVELKVCARAQWNLHRRTHQAEIALPMTEENLELVEGVVGLDSVVNRKWMKPDQNDEQWLSQVEIVTHLGPHRRLWMGPQFTFKTYTITNGAVVETKSVDVRRSKPVNMPVSKANAILIESGSASSCEQLFLDTYHKVCEEVGYVGENRLKEDLADAMLESPGIREQGGHCVIVSMMTRPSVAKVVNPLGTVVTLQSDDDERNDNASDDQETVIHENCDEALFRPLVAPKAVFYKDNNRKQKQCPPVEHMLTRSLEANTEVAVKIINRKNKIDEKCRITKNVCNRSRELSPKVKGGGRLKEVKSKETDVYDGVECEEMKSNLCESILHFEDAEDCTEKVSNVLNKSEIDFPSLSEDDRQVKKIRKPKPKLGVKITKEKENTNLAEEKRSWNIVASSKPKEKILDFEVDCDEIVTIRLPKKEEYKEKCEDVTEKYENLIDIDTENVNSKADDFNLMKLDKSSDETGTTESDDSKITEGEDNLTAVQPTPTAKNARRKSKKKRK